MKHRIPDMLLSRFGTFVAENMGLHFPKARWDDLGRGMERAAGEFGFDDPVACAEWLLAAPLSAAQIEILASHLTIGETYFFREPRSFEALEKQILPELIRARRDVRRLRIWSAGCCTGEEPYSIAILLSRMIDLEDWQVTILGTDINSGFLRKAAEGVYGRWSFRNAPDWIEKGYFTGAGAGASCFSILPRIRKMVEFAYLNLSEDEYPALENNTSAMDVIFCRNVLMYFTPEQAWRVAQRFFRSLADGGILIVSPTEASQTLLADFTPAYLPGVILFKKDLRKSLEKKVSECVVPPVVSPMPAPDIAAVPVARAEQLPVRHFERLPERLPEPETFEKLPEPSLYEEARTLYAEGLYAEVIERLEPVCAPDAGGDEKVLGMLVRACANLGAFDQALGWCEKGMGGDRLNPTYPYLHAMVLQEQGKMAEAGASLRRALYLDPDLAMGHVGLGHLRLRQGEFDKAKRQFETALKLLKGRDSEEMVPEAEGLTAGRLVEMITSTIREGSK